MGNKKEDLVGTIIEINSTKYLIDRVFEVEKEFASERAIEQPRLSMTLIEIKSEKSKVEITPKEKPKIIGFKFWISNQFIYNQKILLIKTFKECTELSLKRAKDIVDSAKYSEDALSLHYFDYIFSKDDSIKEEEKETIEKIRIAWQWKMRSFLHCNDSDLFIQLIY